MADGRFRWAPWIRLFLGVALITFLVRTVGGDALRAAAAPARSHPGWIAAGIALTFIALLVGALRWHVILRIMNLPTPLGRTVRGYFIGQFFNAFLFGACGGDVARAVFAAHAHSEKRAEAVTSVFLDRAIGLMITLFFGCAMLVPRLREFAAYEKARLSLGLMGAFLLATLALLGLFFSRNLFARGPWLRRLAHHGRLGPLLRRACDAVDLFRRNASHLLGPVLLSMVNLLLLAAATAALARALELELSFWDLLTVYPVITVLAALPLTPGSLGVRESLYIQLLHPLGIAPGSALMLSLLGYVVSSLGSLAGVLPLLFPGRRLASPSS